MGQRAQDCRRISSIKFTGHRLTAYWMNWAMLEAQVQFMQCHTMMESLSQVVTSPSRCEKQRRNVFREPLVNVSRIREPLMFSSGDFSIVENFRFESMQLYGFPQQIFTLSLILKVSLYRAICILNNHSHKIEMSFWNLFLHLFSLKPAIKKKRKSFKIY